ncbi:MAG TPA: polysaccharide biosynthesis/export family protein [Flavobacterium sp.]|nr:polysaccharide biosynthesis/export family protein [Flavobacterium sp.]
MRTKFLILYILFALSFASCRSKKEVIYLQGSDQVKTPEALANYETIIQPDDVLHINIMSQNSEAASPFNLEARAAAESSAGALSVQKQTYLVDKEGMIQFPVLGSIKVAGYTRTAFAEMLKEKLRPYVSDAVVNLRVLNFKISVLGEVVKPGVVNVTGDRITLLEVIAQCGDLTLQGIRKNILIVRDNQGVKTFNRVDITQAEFVNSPFYYMKQNDVVYVEPRRTKIDATAIGGNVTTTISILGFLITTTILLTRL